MTMPIHYSTPSQTGFQPWKEGDILYMKSWNHHEDLYRTAGVKPRAAGHPAVLLYRPSPDSEYLVVAIMTTLNGVKLADHPYAQSTPERLRSYIPIHPTPPNAANPLSLKMQPFTTFKSPDNAYVNVGEIYALPGKVLQRFGDKKGHNYSLRKKSLKRLRQSLEADSNFLKAKAVALTHDVAKSYVPDSLPFSPTTRDTSDDLLLPDVPISTRVDVSLPLPPIPGSFPTSPTPASRAPLYSQIAATNHQQERARYAAAPPARSPLLNDQTPLSGTRTSYSVRSIPGSYPVTASQTRRVPQLPTRSIPDYRVASSLERGFSGRLERQPLLGTTGYNRPERDGDGGSSWKWKLLLFGGVVGAVLYFTRSWWWVKPNALAEGLWKLVVGMVWG